MAAPPTETSVVPELRAILDAQRAAIRRNGPPGFDSRMKALRDLRRALAGGQHDLARAVSEDFGNRSAYETRLAEVLVTVAEIDEALRHLGRWMKPRKRLADWLFWPARTAVLYQPRGVVGIMGAWNYPIQLTLAPLVGAIAAGNHVMIRPSEKVPATAAALRHLVEETFETAKVAVCTGELEVSIAFAQLPFDHICFTGSAEVGKLVMANAAKHLTSVTLELGGKSPAIFGASKSLPLHAMRLMRGKLLNAGQTCVAPDYVLVPARRRDELVKEIQNAVRVLYPRFAGNPDYTTIINQSHYHRLQELLADAIAKGATVVPAVAGEAESPNDGFRLLPPFLVLNPTADMRVMQEEIFGPILPILECQNIEEAIRYVNDHDRPLALYYFGDDPAERDRVLRETVSGGASVNDTLYHLPQTKLPFGGVGASGMGRYHGREGFLEFSKAKGVFLQSRWTLVDRTARPPYGRLAEWILRLVVGGRSAR